MVLLLPKVVWRTLRIEMKKLIIIPAVCIALFSNAQSASFEEKKTDVSNTRLTVTNVGTFGNAFRGYRDGSGNPSCEYPAGSGIEHLFEAGIWFGGLLNGNQVLVSTSAFDQPQGYATGRAGYEFTGQPGSKLEEQSSLFDSPFYSPNAVSHQDFVASYTDTNLFVPGTGGNGGPGIPIASHVQPLNIKVNQKTYNWNFTFSDFLVFLDFEIINLGRRGGAASTIDSAYFSFYANTVVRNINITPAGSGGAAFYVQGGNGFMDSLDLAYCYDKTGDVGFTDSYIGQKFLGAEDKAGFHHPQLDSSFNSHYSAWTFNNSSDPIFFQPINDNARYIKQTNGLNDSPCWNDGSASGCTGRSYQQSLNDAGNRSDLVSIGPFRNFEEGDTIRVSYAIVMAKKFDDGNPTSANTLAQRANLISNADRAQTAYNGEDVNFNGILDVGEDKDNNGKITRFILPEPPLIPRTKVVAQDKKIELYWTADAEESIDPITQKKDFEGYRIYLSKLGFDVTGVQNLTEDLVALDEFDVPANGLFNDIGLTDIRLTSPITFDGDTNVYQYKYVIDNLLDGWQYAVAVSSFDTGDEESNLESLESTILGNTFRVFPGKKPSESFDENEPFAYPNPYYLGASWEGRSNFQEQSRKLIFSNLPERCIIRVFTPAGDLIDEINHDPSYDGSDIRWYDTFGAERNENNKFSGGEHAWDLLSKSTQILSRGIYLFSVENLDNNEQFRGKFTIIK